MKKTVYILLLLVVPITLNAYTFTQSLTVGSEGQDVYELQKYLNSNQTTQVSTTGAGSPGQESSYFGEKTKQAVIKLQNLFSSTILAPVGLISGSGFVGNSTISFLNKNQKIQTSTPSSINNNSISTNTSNASPKNIPVVVSVTPEEVTGNETIIITGSNFSEKNNQIIFGFEGRYDYMNIESKENGTVIEVDYESSIKKVYEERYGNISKEAKKRVAEMFPTIDIAVSVITDAGQSNFKIIKFNLN